jgi:4'-phosphopantetheinyl transferase
VTEQLQEQCRWAVMAGPIEAPPLTCGEIQAIRLDQSDETVDACAETLSEDELEKAGRYVFSRDRRRFIVARAALRRLLAHELSMQPGAIKFTYGRYGKPSLAAPLDASNLQFNVAHSDDLAIIALCRHREVGVDIEAIRPLDDELSLVTSCFSPHERAQYLHTAPEARTVAFFCGWTRKEAFIKALGNGFSEPLDSFDVSLAPDSSALLRVGDRSGRDSGWSMASFNPGMGFAGAIVTRGQQTLLI